MTADSNEITIINKHHKINRCCKYTAGYQNVAQLNILIKSAVNKTLEIKRVDNEFD